jgi:hypothetical protein
MAGFGIYSVKLPFARPFVIQGGSVFVIKHIATVILNVMLTT